MIIMMREDANCGLTAGWCKPSRLASPCATTRSSQIRLPIFSKGCDEERCIACTRHSRWRAPSTVYFSQGEPNEESIASIRDAEAFFATGQRGPIHRREVAHRGGDGIDGVADLWLCASPLARFEEKGQETQLEPARPARCYRSRHRESSRRRTLYWHHHKNLSKREAIRRLSG